jgi:hypothetical protein
MPLVSSKYRFKKRLGMYPKVLGSSVATGSAVVLLPNTGSNLIVSVALSAAAGLVAWGALYVFANK